MSRERLAAAYDALAEAYAQVAHELRGTEQPVAGASAPQASAPAPTQAAGRPASPSRATPAAAARTFDRCPAHLKEWKPSKFEDGPGYCTAKSDDPAWSKNGYCAITERSAAKWAEIQHAARPAPQDVDDIPF